VNIDILTFLYLLCMRTWQRSNAESGEEGIVAEVYAQVLSDSSGKKHDDNW